ncbi:MAG: hypothetical protein EZS28_010883 [Streblomastix strix]|uniref:Protein kinase domain-containing protein n=1 Tax=Streblomastix strix TaxID=222440 RepID=A0A5J4WGE3_9EUKA|nr:MAG: hypothetical protein EZS28_010883 [Streblomastix strix]
MLLFQSDLKFLNILLARDQDPQLFIPKVCDFGLSTTISNLEHGKVVGCTPNYYPPEVIRNTKRQGCKIDIWSLGLVMYILATGKFDKIQLN